MQLTSQRVAASAIALASLAVLTSAQSSDLAPISFPVPVPVSTPQMLGGVVRGPFDVQSAPFDDRCLGVQYGWGYFWVTGRGHSSVGDVRRIHQFDLQGTYLQSFAQTTNSPTWGGRDLECDPQTHRLWTGAENGEVAEYHFDPQTGPSGQLVPVAMYQVPGLSSIVRALARDPSTDHFFTADFNGPILEFDLTGGLIASHPNPGLQIYGASWDFVDRTIWFWSQDPGSATNLDRASEWDPSTGALTGRAFDGLDLFPGLSSVAGGADVYPDPLNPGALTLVALHQATYDSIVSYDVRLPVAAPHEYCTAKTSSLGCVPTLSTSDPSAAPGAGEADYHVVASNLNGQKSGLLFYGTAGSNAVPFQGGYLCVRPPLHRTALANSGGNANDCSGVLDLVVNDPSGLDFAVGQQVWFQAWFRDPMSLSTTGLSDGLELTFAAPLAAAGPAKWEVGGGEKTSPVVAIATDSNYRIKNDGPSRIKVHRLDAKGKVIAPEVHLPANGTVDIGVNKGESLEIVDDDGAANGGAKGTFEKL